MDASRTVILLAAWCAVHCLPGLADEIPAPLRDVRRIVSLGDSITQGGDYVTDFDCWLVSRGIADKTSAAAPPDRPNVLWITCEDMSPELGCYGSAYARTPHIDRLASEGVRYTRAFATAPVCSPARSCLITGVPATSLGTMNLRSRLPVPAALRGFPALLRAEGYYCTNNVKTDYNTRDEPAIVAASWDESSPRAHWRSRKPGQPFFAVFNGMVTHQSRTFESFDGEMEKLLPSEERHDPALAPLPPYYPDTPAARRTIARFHDCVTVLDRDHVGRILRELEEDSLAGDTIVFFFSDHGSGLPRHKRTLHDSGLRVPLIIRFPAAFRRWAPAAPGGSVDRLVCFADFGPTVLSLAGVAAPSEMEGLPFLGPAAAPARTAVFGARDRVDEAFDLSRSVRDERYLYIRNFMPHLSWLQPEGYSDQLAFRRELEALAAAGRLDAAAFEWTRAARPLEELYEVEADPHMVRNLAGSPEHREARDRMRAAVRDRILASRDLGFLPEPELIRRSAGVPPRDMARRGDAYPLERILDAAALAGKPEALGRMEALLEDADPAVRFWAALGLRSLGRAGAPSAPALRKALADSSPCVRIEAAAALAGVEDRSLEDAIGVLAACLRGEDLDVALRAARALQLLGPKALPALEAMEETLAEATRSEGDSQLSLRFALEPAVAALRRPAAGR